MKLSEFLVPEAIITDLVATTKEAAIREIVRNVQNAGHLAHVDTEVLIQAFMKREELGSTAVGHDVAVPHKGHPLVKRTFGTIALSRQGVEFDSLDSNPVDIIVLLIHDPEDYSGRLARPGGINDAIGSVAPYLKDERFLDRVRACWTRQEVVELIAEVDHGRSSDS
jgi:PTS system fructose-specific IIA component/PTS system nitrogen regulatory IIA component